MLGRFGCPDPRPVLPAFSASIPHRLTNVKRVDGRRRFGNGTVVVYRFDNRVTDASSPSKIVTHTRVYVVRSRPAYVIYWASSDAVVARV